MTFIKYSVADIQPLNGGDEMPIWAEAAILGQPVDEEEKTEEEQALEGVG